MKESINVFSVFWRGDQLFRGRDFFLFDVQRLYFTVKKHIGRPFKFYCLTNYEGRIPDYINKIPLKHDWRGWWSKMELGRPDLPPGRALYLDLDTQVIRSLEPILEYDGELCCFETGIPKKKWAHLNRNRWVCRYQNATILFDSGGDKINGMYNRFKVNPDRFMMKYRSDQDIYGAWHKDLPMFPYKWMIKLPTIIKQELTEAPDEVIIVTNRLKNGKFRKESDWVEIMA